MLRDAELRAVAQKYAAEFYPLRCGSDYAVRLRATLRSAPGVYFQAVYPSRLRATGDGGFFVGQADGRITHLGAGELLHEELELVRDRGRAPTPPPGLCAPPPCAVARCGTTIPTLARGSLVTHKGSSSLRPHANLE